MEHIGREQTETVFGKSYTFARWDRGIWSEMFQYARRVLPSPVEEASKHVDRFPQPVAEFLVRAALDLATSYIAVGSPQMQSLLASIEGNSHLTYLLLKKNHPQITEDEAFDVFQALSQRKSRAPKKGEKESDVPSRLQEIFSLCAGKSQSGNVEAPPAS